MAANINDKFRKTFNSENPNVTFVSSTRTALATTLSCDSLTGWPTDTAVDFITYKLDTDGETVIPGSQTDWKGIVSGSTITELTRVAGAADAGNDVNDIVEMTPTGTWGNDLIETLLVSHDQDGTLKDKIVALANVNGGGTEGVLHTSSSGDVTGSKVVNADLSTIGGEIGGPTQSWSPTLTGFSANPGSSSYRYIKVGRLVTLFIAQGSNGTSNATSFRISLPFTAATVTNQQWCVPIMQPFNNGAANTTSPGMALIDSGGTDVYFFRDPNGSTWTASGGKRIPWCQISYEAAS